MKLPKVREIAEAAKSLTHRPYTARFPSTPHEPVLSFRGQPKFDSERCVGCLACEQVCPAEAIAHRDEISDGVGRRIMIHYTDTCIFCGTCETACIADHEGIRLSLEWELSFFDRSSAFETIEKELVLCELCGAPIACRDHLEWIAGRIGELAFGNPTLYQTSLANLGALDAELVQPAQAVGRADRGKVLCARCRRRTTLTTSSPPAPEAPGGRR